MWRWFVFFVLLAPYARADDRFDRTIAPILASRCLDCHSGLELEGELDLSRYDSALQGGESGPAFVPGNSAESLLLERILADEMPPKHPLEAKEKQLLTEWIQAGAVWGSDPINPFRYSNDHRAGYDWWALRPVKRPPVPTFEFLSAMHQNPIDVFVTAKHKEKGLSESEEADRRTLIRRVSFDLLGLPPSSEEIDAFIRDESPVAYEQLVDRLLATPAYGERWTRHWLDVARFGESQGFERDKLRTNSWRYRDWLIDAFNDDLPYDEFVRLQLAGDVLYPDRATAKIATGFLVAGAYDEVGQSQLSAAMKAIVRQDELEDLVSVVGQTFLGLTINCARCHDHKFDPVTQKEYYELTAALAGVRHGQREAVDKSLATSSTDARQHLAARIHSIEDHIAAIERPVRDRLLATRDTAIASTSPPQPIAMWDFDENFNDSIGTLHGKPSGSARIENGGLVLDGSSFVATTTLDRDITEKTLEAWVVVSELQQRGGGAISLQQPSGATFDAIVFGERQPHRWLAGSNGFVRTQDFGGAEETEASPQPVHIAIVYAKDGTITGYRNGQPYGKSYKSSGLATFKANDSQVIFGLRHSPPGGNRFLTGTIDRARLYDRALSPIEVAASAGTTSHYVAEAELAAALSNEQRLLRSHLRFEQEQLQSQYDRYDESTVYAVTPRTPEPAHVLIRGNPGQKAEAVSAGGVDSLVGVDANFGLALDASDAERREKLAAWVTDRHNPLFARVAVNRLWHYHFGVGLVDTPNDFGFNGGRPTHPKLLDFLAHELVTNNWSMKSIHRLIVTSATYRQGSRFDSVQSKIDAGNGFLWRKMPRRLEAETIRDTVLAISGELNPTMHGPGYHDFRTFTFNSQFYEMLDPVGATFNRRSLYRTWVRSGRNQFLDIFDCPDPSSKAPQRAVTTTPLQALSMLNNSFVLRMADRFAARIESKTATDAMSQSREAYRLAFGRIPSDRELRITTAFIEQRGLAPFCRAIFNSNEFLYVD
jgi:Protein of unknown function (DUF1553)/Protein of unknown function (DUF1549)/Planctomycete cytochrome C/Concanavalin A-like lectin/glucanases superfamily